MKFSVLLISCYELGHQPLSLAWPLAALQQAGIASSAVDLALEDFPLGQVNSAHLVAIAVPMHTALRIGVDAARRVRAVHPEAHLCFFGLYAWLNRAYLLQERIADSVVAGEAEPVLVALAQTLAAGRDLAAIQGLCLDPLPSEVEQANVSQGRVARGEAAHQNPTRLIPPGASPHLARWLRARKRRAGQANVPVPERSALPSLDRYAHYMADDMAHMAGYVEASRGCLHTCRHCPVVPVYNGRFFVVPVEIVLADVQQQVEAGAEHITFGDPDFLNGPGHARKVAQALHIAFPQVSFDFTTKVEHILQQRALLPELVACGASFVVSAFESTSDQVLARLQKGHTRPQMEEAVAMLQEIGLPVQPTWMPFTPWTALDDFLFMLDWIREQGLIPHVPAVQLSIRMLVPPGSALLLGEDVDEWRGTLDPANFTYRWQHADPRMDRLQQQVAQIVEDVQEDADPFHVFRRVEQAAYKQAGRPTPHWPMPSVAIPRPPRLTEHWFC